MMMDWNVERWCGGSRRQLTARVCVEFLNMFSCGFPPGFSPILLSKNMAVAALAEINRPQVWTHLTLSVLG